MWTFINLQHKKPEIIFGYVLEYYGDGGEYLNGKKNHDLQDVYKG